MAHAEDDIQLDYQNFPVDGNEAIVKEIGFGPVSPDFALLIELDPAQGPIRVTVGNGPAHEQAPGIVAEILRDVANVVEDLQDNEEYWSALRESQK